MEQTDFLVALRVKDNILIDKVSNNIWSNYSVNYSDNGSGIFGNGAISLPGIKDQQLYLKQNILYGLYDKEFTISFWMKYAGPTSNATTFYPLCIEKDIEHYTGDTDDCADISLSYRSGTNNWLYGQLSYPTVMAGYSGKSASAFSYVVNTWTHIALVWKNYTLYFFINGTLISSKVSSSSPNIFNNSDSTIVTKIGNQKFLNYSDYSGKGLVDDFSILNKAVWTDSFTVPNAYLYDLLIEYRSYQDIPGTYLYGYK